MKENQDLRSALGRLREGTRKDRLSDVSSIEDHGKPWNMYATDAKDYIGSLQSMFPDIVSLPDRLRERHEKGEKVVVLDMCGEADAKSIGADHTICFTLVRSPAVPEDSSRTVIEGDIFSSKDIGKLMNTIRSQSGSLSCIFFIPRGGLVMSDEGDPLASARMYGVLRKLYSCLAEDGEIYIPQTAFWMKTNMRTVKKNLNQLAPEPFCEPQDDFGYGLMHVIKRQSAPRSLPPLNQLLGTADGSEVEGD